MATVNLLLLSVGSPCIEKPTAENRCRGYPLKSGNGVNYTYDGDLRRVEKSNGKLYWYSINGQILQETDLSGNPISDYVYLGGKLVWRRDASGNVYFDFTDPLGTVRGIYNSGSSLCYDADFYPFGAEKVVTNTCAQNYKFTGLERDAESGLDDTLYRKYSSNLGRWLEVDPKRGCIAHPQGLNRYVYVADNPATFTDPSGLSYCDTHPDAVACNREPRLVEITDLGFLSGDISNFWDFGFDIGFGGWLPSGGGSGTPNPRGYALCRAGCKGLLIRCAAICATNEELTPIGVIGCVAVCVAAYEACDYLCKKRNNIP